MTDQELVILKAIQHADKRGGLALISEVVRSVGYPKATAKKALIGLAGKGIVFLHRHDYPGSLSPADRKLMVNWKGNYYSAVSVAKKNPRGRHLPGLPAKAQREYEHVLKSEKAMGRTVKRAKQIAAGKVRKDYGPNPHGASEKAWKAFENNLRKSIAAYRSKAWTFQQIKDRLWLRYGVTLDRLEEDRAHFASVLGSGGFTLDLVPPLERRRMASKAKKQNVSARKMSVPKVWRVKPTSWGGVDWQAQLQPGDPEAYKRQFASPGAFDSYLIDYFGFRFAKKGMAALTRSKGEYVGEGLAKFRNPRRKNTTVIRAKKIGKVIVRKAPNPKTRNRDYPYWNVYHIDMKKSPPYDKTFLGSSSFGMDKKEAIEKFRRSHYPGRLRAGTKIVAEKGVVSMPDKQNPKRKAAKKRKRNIDHPDSSHPVMVHKHWRSGGLSQWQRAHKAGQKPLFEHGIKARNASRASHSKSAKTSRAGTSRKSRKASVGAGKRVHKRNATPIKGVIAKAVKAVKKVLKKKSNPTRKGMRKGYREAKRVSKITRGRYHSSESEQRKAARHEKRQERKSKRNPSPASIRETFAGRHSKDDKLIFPDGTPQGLAKLGRLVSIDTDAGKIKPVHGVAWLCSDTKGKLHIGTPTTGHVVFGGPAQDFGKVREIEYQESKPHLGYTKQTIFFHKLGEETGVKPRLVTDGKGGAKFVGGAYQIKREGIIN